MSKNEIFKQPIKYLDLIKPDLDKLSKDTGIAIDPKCQGKGQSALVYYGTKDGKSYAIKVIIIPPIESEEVKTSIKTRARNEMGMTSFIRNINCIRCYGNFEMANSRILVLEKAVNRDLGFLINLFYNKKLFSYLLIMKPIRKETNKDKERVDQKYFWMNYMSETFIKFFFIQIIDTLSFLSCVNIIHRDIKPENILLLLNFQIKLGDFALAQNVNSYGEYKISNVGTLLYKSPESFEKDKMLAGKLASKIDLFALGVLLHKMAYNKYLFDFNETNSDYEEEEYKKLKINKETVLEKLQDIWNKGKTYFFEKGRSKEMTSYDIILAMLKLLDKDIVRRSDITEIKQLVWVTKHREEIRKLHEFHDNDYLKFLIELQKFDCIGELVGVGGRKVNSNNINYKVSEEEEVIETAEYFHYKICNKDKIKDKYKYTVTKDLCSDVKKRNALEVTKKRNKINISINFNFEEYLNEESSDEDDKKKKTYVPEYINDVPIEKIDKAYEELNNCIESNNRGKEVIDFLIMKMEELKLEEGNNYENFNKLDENYLQNENESTDCCSVVNDNSKDSKNANVISNDEFKTNDFKLFDNELSYGAINNSNNKCICLPLHYLKKRKETEIIEKCIKYLKEEIERLEKEKNYLSEFLQNESFGIITFLSFNQKDIGGFKYPIPFIEKDDEFRRKLNQNTLLIQNFIDELNELRSEQEIQQEMLNKLLHNSITINNKTELKSKLASLVSNMIIIIGNTKLKLKEYKGRKQEFLNEFITNLKISKYILKQIFIRARTAIEENYSYFQNLGWTFENNKFRKM